MSDIYIASISFSKICNLILNINHSYTILKPIIYHLETDNIPFRNQSYIIYKYHINWFWAHSINDTTKFGFHHIHMACKFDLYNRAYLIHNTSILYNNHTTYHDSKLIQLKTQQNSVFGRNHLTCAFLTSGHILRLSSRLSPSLTTSHPHIKFRAAILQAQLTHLTFLFCFMWPLLELSSMLSFKFHISEGYPPGSASLSHIFLTIWDYSSHRDPRSIIIQISIHISQFHYIFHISQFHISI